jgi:N-acylglucosamine 2-epimerase
MATPTRLDCQDLRPLLTVYRDGLLHDTLPFWIPRAIDREHGGYITSLDEDGTVIHTDKPVWFQGRFAWLFATLYSTVERRAQWLELARHGIEFMNRCCFDAEGRMFFSVTREGRPLRRRRYLYAEIFAICGKGRFICRACSGTAGDGSKNN